MKTLKRKLLEYRKTQNIEALRTFMSTINVKTATDFISSIWSSTEVISLITDLLKGFADTANRQQELIKYMLDNMGTQIFTAEAQIKLINLFFHYIKGFNVKCLVELSSICVGMIHMADSNTTWIWSKVLPLLLSLLSVQHTINYNGLDYTGSAYKAEIINEICIVRWPTDIVFDLATMFGRMKLSKDEYYKVSNKFCLNMLKMNPSSVHKLLDKLLKLCEIYGDIYPIFTLCHYFSTLLHKDSQYVMLNQQQDIEQINIKKEDIIQSEQKVLHHIKSIVTNSSQHDWIVNFMQALRTINKWPDFILSTFPIMLLLVMASSADLKTTIFDIIIIACLRKIKAFILISQSALVRETIAESEVLDNLFGRLVEKSVKDNVTIKHGLVGLAMSFLHYSGDCSKELNKIGVTILLKLSRKNKNLASSIMGELMNNIDNMHSEMQYSYCFHNMVKYIPLTLIENEEIVMKGILKATEKSQKYIFKSIMPLIKYSSSIRDAIIMLIRKNIFMSDDTLKREMGVYILCLLLQNLKIDLPNSASLTQQSLLARTSSIFSQMACTQEQLSDVKCNTSSFEMICLQIFEILKYGIKKQSSNKVETYEGLIEAVERNTPISCNILDILYENLQQYVMMDEDNKINFDRLVLVVEDNIIVIDSLGHLIVCMSFILAKALGTEEHVNNNRILKDMQDLLQLLCAKMKDSCLAVYGFDQDMDITSNIDILKNFEILNQLTMFQESLVIYKLSLWKSGFSDSYEDEILALFTTYMSYINYCETRASKGLKQIKKKSKINQSESQLQQSVTNLKFKTPKTLFTLPLLTKLLEILLSKKSKIISKCLKTNVEIHRHALKALLINLEEVDTLLELTDKETKKSLLIYFIKCGSILYENCLSKLNVLSDFDLITAVSSVEVFFSILNLMDKYFKMQIPQFIAALRPEKIQENLQQSLQWILSQFKCHLKNYLQDEGVLDVNFKITLNLIRCIQIFCKHVPLSSKQLLFETAEWLEILLVELKNNEPVIAKAMLEFVITFDARIRITSSICANAAGKICSVTGTINNEEHMTNNSLIFINEETLKVVIQVISDKCKEDLARIDWVIQYINGYFTVCSHTHNMSVNFDCEYLEEKESSVCTYICHIILILNSLSNAQLPAGNCTDILFKTLQTLYDSLSEMAKYFFKRVLKSPTSFLKARFDKVVKLAGKKLCVTVYRLITHVEEMQDNKHKSRVLQQTRIIPSLIYAIEKFKKSIIRLASKTNNSTKELLTSALNIGTTRDFRLQLQTLQSALNSGDEDETSETEGESTSRSSSAQKTSKRIRLK